MDGTAKSVERAYLDVAQRWCAAAEAVDGGERGHSTRAAMYACAIADAAGVEAGELIWYRIGALLHDVGKSVIPPHILCKPGALTTSERRVVERHPVIGADMISAVDWPFDVGLVVLHHHERWDGGGYPHGLSREAIPFPARVMAIADVFDALTSERPYRPAYSPRQALAIMMADAEGAFDPALFDLFRTMMMPRIVSPVPARVRLRATA